MALLTKTTDKTLVNGSESFIYTFQVSYSGLTQPAQNGELTDFFPSKILYTLPPIEGPIQNIIQTPVPGGTNVTFQFGPVNAGTSFSFTVACQFGPGRVDNDTFTNTGLLFADGVQVSQSTAATVTLHLTENFTLLKESLFSNPIRPGQLLTFRLTLTNAGDAGASVQNIVITDILPPQLIPDLSFTPVGDDIPVSGYSDPTYDGRTGSWSGQTLTFTLPSYHGVRYEIRFRATVANNVIPGETFSNTATWTINGSARPDTSALLRVFSESDIFGLEKSGNRTGAVSKPIFYSIVNRNQDLVSYSNYRLVDTLPDEVDITALSFSAPTTAIPSYSIYITVSSGGPPIPVLLNQSGNTGSVDLTPFIPPGARITTIIVEAPVLNPTEAYHSMQMFGIVNQTATPGETIINTATATADNVTRTVTYPTVLNGQSDLNSSKTFVPLQPAYTPLEEFKVALSTGPLNTFTIDPIFADLLPDSLIYVENSEYFVYRESSTGNTYDSRMPGFPVTLPIREIIDNYDGTGRRLLRWTFADFTLPMGDLLQVFFTVFVKITPASTFTNNAFVGNPGKDVLFVYTSIPDTRDYDGDGITDEIISATDATGVILTTSEFSIRKLVKGANDMDYSSLGNTTAGGNLTYQLLITNNQAIDLKNIELVDIFPYIGDTGVILTDVPRGSQFFVYPTDTISAEIVNLLGDPVVPPPEITIWYSTSNDPVRFDVSGNPIGTGTWSLIPPVDITTLRSIKITTGPNTILHPYERLIITVQAKTPVNTPVGQIAYNSFAVRADQILGTVIEPLLPTEPNKVGIRIITASGSSIGQLVWEDLNENGIYDPGEPGVNGATVELYSSAGVLLASTVTSNNQAMAPGYYIFNGLLPGEYYVRFLPPGVCRLTQQRADEPNGSKPDPVTGTTSVFPLALNQHRTDINAGLICQCRRSPYTQAVTDLITSVALEQAALALVLNAEGLKIQRAVALNTTTQELISVNKSVTRTINTISQLEFILSGKLGLFECIICEPDCP